MSRFGRIGMMGKNDFLRSASALVGGTAAAQALTVLALPILTRLYSPEDFSILAVYIAILTTAQVVVCLRLEIAIPLPESDDEAANLLALSAASALCFSALVGVFIWAFGDWFFGAINQPAMQPYGWLLPIGLAFAGLYAAIQYWSSRKRRFAAIAGTRMTQSGAGLTAQLGMGWFGTGAIGLLIGHAIMSGAGVLKLARHARREDLAVLRAVSFAGMRRALSTYRRFPLYSTWDGFFTIATIQVPILLISVYVIGPEVGYLMLAIRIVGAPVQLVGAAVAQVYLANAPDYLRNGCLYQKTRRIAWNLFLFVSLPSLIGLGIAAPYFGFFFGQDWSAAGRVALWLAPMFAVRTVASTISMVMNVLGRQRQMMAMKLGGFVIRLGATYIGAKFYGAGVEAYAISGGIVYFVYLVVFLNAPRNFSRDVV